MNTIYSTDNIEWAVVAAMFAEVGWGQRDPIQIRSAFEQSSHVMFMYEAGELVAFGRTMDDGCYYGMLVDVVVKPGRQHAGLGREIVTCLREKLAGYKFITLTAAPGKEEFYLKLGWLRQSTAMIWPVSEQQRELHANVLPQSQAGRAPPHPEFEIGRGVRLAPIAASDATSLSCLVKENIDHLKAFLPAVVQLASVEQSTMHLDRGMQAAAEGDMLEWHIFENGILCGAVRVKDIDHSARSASIAYFIGARFQGRGIVTLSVSAVIEYCAEHLGLNRIELRCAATNAASMQVANRLGFSLEGVLKQAECLDGAFVDHHVFGLLARQRSAGL